VHAARIAKAQAALEMARRQRDFTARQLALCEVRAPVAGVATLMPLPVAGEYRTVHVGDTLYRNQTFLCLPDRTDHVIRGYVGEADLPQVRAGSAVEAVATAFPHVKLTGRVETVGGMAQNRPGAFSWRKYFPVLIALEPLPEPMPVGISVQAEIVAGEARNVLLLPREAVGVARGAGLGAPAGGQGGRRRNRGRGRPGRCGAGGNPVRAWPRVMWWACPDGMNKFTSDLWTGLRTGPARAGLAFSSLALGLFAVTILLATFAALQRQAR
jgi:hypothetical protein